MKRIITYNVNGVRSAISKGFHEWLKACNPDIVLLQEIKAEAVALEGFKELGYEVYVHPAVKKGYSGVAILTKEKPLNVSTGCGIERYDCEGRVLRADYAGGYSVMSVYLPSGSSGEERQAFKFEMLHDFYELQKEWRTAYPKLIIGGDFNICHREIDIHNPKSNARSSGFLPEERAWMEKLLTEGGFIDSFRYKNAEPHNYTWWSYRANARAKNLGWRIDYIIASEALKDSISRSLILSEAKHSDHCPVLTEFTNL